MQFLVQPSKTLPNALTCMSSPGTLVQRYTHY
uniref:Pco123869 n=1 Tax=Arundo donax TaxID=35708 RepID=A0A0A9FUC7_ARUDO